MENLVDLLPLLFIAAYYLLSGRRKAQQRKAARERTEAPQEALVPSSGDGARERSPTPFESFLSQLETAMAEASGVAAEEREVEVKTTPVPPAALESTPAREFKSVPGSFDAPDAVDHGAHGFGTENPLSEEVFETAPAFAARPTSGRRDYDPHGLRPKPTPPMGASPNWRRRLGDPQTARDAFVLQTIFGPRGGIRGDRQGRKR
ncbi:hypothetical protein [Rubrivirga marina]|uniref:Uncharacterized protein n=1 Tax=Rubrivirga marina TaxID=1196024 RepID=A0A271J1N1_9BACT|nr:hypothetical protein [Rubrivirga marina]PAP77363.1 hypothetical protein BSZ37_13430 [Rubrivirga marina]